MKTVSDDLFRLIKTLSKAEKSYFKKYAAKNTSGSKQNYILLFDAIDSMVTYDESLLRKKLRKESFIKQLPVYKVYLFNLILKSLSILGAYENAESKLTEMLLNVRTLEAKHLYREALKILKKAKAIALKFDKMKFMHEILHIERHILLGMPEKNSYEKRKAIYLEQKKVLEMIGNFYEYSWLCDQMTILVDQQADYRSGGSAAKIEEIVSSPLMQDENLPISYNAKMNFYHTLLQYSGSKGDNKKIFYYLNKEIELAEKNKHFIDDNPQNYVFALINLLLYSSYEKNNTAVKETLQKLKVVRERLKNKIPRETEIQIFLHASNVEMLICEKTCDMARGKLKAKEIEKDLAGYGSDVPLNLKALMLMNLACFNIVDGNFDGALRSVNSVLNNSELNLRSDVIDVARLLQLLIHYELNNYDLLEYLTDSAAKYFKSRKLKNKAEGILTEFFREITGLDRAMHKGAFDELLFKLKRISDNTEESNPQVYFDFPAWAKSKAEGKSMVDVIRSQK